MLQRPRVTENIEVVLYNPRKEPHISYIRSIEEIPGDEIIVYNDDLDKDNRVRVCSKNDAGIDCKILYSKLVLLVLC